MHVERLGKYRILRQLGHGGMGTVYLAEHEVLRIRRAVKVLLEKLSHEPDAQRRFLEEARIVARLVHPNIVQVHDAETLDGTMFIAMDFVSPDGNESVALDHYLEARGRQLPHAEAASLLVPVLRALVYAHEQGVVHCDIKPANILLDRGCVPRVSDFGLAQMAGDELFTSLSLSASSASIGALASLGVMPPGPGALDASDSMGALESRLESGAALSPTSRAVGTPHFMPPEVLNKSGTWSKQGDVYSLGVLAYLMLTGHYPVGQYRPPHALDGNIPNVWDEVVERALVHDPSERYGSVEEMLEQLLEAYPLLGGDDAQGAGALRRTTAGDVPESAVRSVRDFVTRHKATWSSEQWLDFVIGFYRTPGHDPVTKEQLEKLCNAEKSVWLERDAKRREDEARRAEDAAQRRREAEEARRRAELERRKEDLRRLAGQQETEGNLTNACRTLRDLESLGDLNESDRKTRQRLLDAMAKDVVERAEAHLAADRYDAAEKLYQEAASAAEDVPELTKHLSGRQQKVAEARLEHQKRELRDRARHAVAGKDAASACRTIAQLQALGKANGEDERLRVEVANAIVDDVMKRVEAFTRSNRPSDAIVLLDKTLEATAEVPEVSDRLKLVFNELRSKTDSQVTNLRITAREASGKKLFHQAVSALKEAQYNTAHDRQVAESVQSELEAVYRKWQEERKRWAVRGAKFYFIYFLPALVIFGWCIGTGHDDSGGLVALIPVINWVALVAIHRASEDQELIVILLIVFAAAGLVFFPAWARRVPK